MTDIDQIRARFQPRTRGGYEYEIFAERDGELWGRFRDSFGVWNAHRWALNGISARVTGLTDLIPRNPHEELISRAREIKDRLPWVEEPDIANVLVALIEALEQEIKK